MKSRHPSKPHADARDARYSAVREREISIEEIKQRIESELCLPVVEEFDRWEYIWFPEMSGEELEEFWRNIEIGGDGFWSRESHGFPGTFLCVYEYISNNNHRNLYDDEGVSAFIDIHKLLCDRPATYHAHICCNRDSHLITPDWTPVFHKSHDNVEGRKSVIAWAARCKAKNYRNLLTALHPTLNPDKEKILELINISDQKAVKWLRDLDTGELWYWPASWVTHANMAAELKIRDYDKGVVVEE